MIPPEIEISEPLLITSLLSWKEYHTGKQKKAYNMQTSS